MNKSTKKLKKRKKKSWRQMKMKTQCSEIFGMQQICCKTEVYSNMILLQEENSQMDNRTLDLKDIGAEKRTKPHTSGSKETIKSWQKL